MLIERYLSGSCQEGAERVKVNEIVALWRERLSDISWFMRCLNESIALKANQEDQCTGRFWEGRFKSQALLNEQALLSCMAYVDLNPVRAGIAESLDSSDFTSIEQRIREIQSAMDDCDNDVSKDDKEACGFLKLAIFVGSKDKAGIPFTFKDYLELTDWTGRTIRENKTGFISDKQPRMLDKLGLDSETWFKVLNQYSDRLYSHLGTEQQLKSVCHESGKKWLAGIKSCRQLFSD